MGTLYILVIVYWYASLHTIVFKPRGEENRRVSLDSLSYRPRNQDPLVSASNTCITGLGRTDLSVVSSVTGGGEQTFIGV